MSATPQGVQALITAGEANLAKTKGYNPNGTFMKIALADFAAASVMAGQLVAPPPPTPPPPPSGTVLFDGRAKLMTALKSYEVPKGGPPLPTNGPITWPDGSVHYFYLEQEPVMWDCLCFIKNDMSLQADPRYGQVFKVAAETGDTNPWHGSTGGNVNGAAEMSKERPNDLGQTFWYATAVRIDGWEGGASDLRFGEVMSLGYQTSSNSQVALGLLDNGGALSFSLNVNAGYADGVQGNAPGTTSFKTPLLPVTFGQWEEFVLGVKWATDKTGMVEIHHRPIVDGVPGQWSQVLEKAGIDTELYGPIYNSEGALILNFAQDGSNWPVVLDKFGLYWGTNDNAVQQQQVLTSGFARCSDLATAQGTFPA